MSLELKQTIGVLVLVAAAVMLVAAAVGTSVAGASEFKTIAFPVSILGEGLGLTTYLSEKLNFVACENTHSKGSFENSTLATETITFLTKCELEVVTPLVFKEACPTITTNKLDIVPLSKLNGGTKTGLLYLPFTGSELAKFTCSGSNKTEVKVKGSVICESTPIGSQVTKSKDVCKAGTAHGTQEFSSGTNPSGATVTAGLTAESTLGIFKITEKDSAEGTLDLEYSKAIEQTA
jgi:hypothetical protein